jgi:hypothetical protein
MVRIPIWDFNSAPTLGANFTPFQFECESQNREVGLAAPGILE